jgi:hypothetical protein
MLGFNCKKGELDIPCNFCGYTRIKEYTLGWYLAMFLGAFGSVVVFGALVVLGVVLSEWIC